MGYMKSLAFELISASAYAVDQITPVGRHEAVDIGAPVVSVRTQIRIDIRRRAVIHAMRAKLGVCARADTVDTLSLAKFSIAYVTGLEYRTTGPRVSKIAHTLLRGLVENAVGTTLWYEAQGRFVPRKYTRLFFL